MTPADDPGTYEQIRRLALRYALAIDRRDLEMLVSLFVDDVRVGRDRSGRVALRETFDADLRRIGVSMLFVGNHLIDLDPDDPDRATGVVYCLGRIQPEPGSDRMIEQAIQYEDTYERRDGSWLFVRRRHELFWGVELAERPLEQAPANWPEHQTGTGTIPYRYDTWTQFWR